MKHYKKESDFQADVIKMVKNRFPGCYCVKQETRQGTPDLLVLHQKHWAMLENKIDENAEHQPNQDWYVDHFNDMSFAAFVYPSNVEEVLNEMERSFQDCR